MSDKLQDDEVRALDRPVAGRESMVPASYAEKAMSSLLRLHEDLVEEKEKRIDLYRRLMEREQSLAEMRAYMKLLEGELARRGFDPTQYAIEPADAPLPSAAQRQAVAVAAAAHAVAPAAAAPVASVAAAPAASAPVAPASAASAPVAPAAAAPAPAPAAPAANTAASVRAPARPTATPSNTGAPVIAWTPFGRAGERR